MQKHTHRNTVPRTSEGLLDMVNDGGGGVAGSICYVGVVGCLLFSRDVAALLAIVGVRVANALPCEAGAGLSLWGGEVKSSRESEYRVE